MFPLHTALNKKNKDYDEEKAPVSIIQTLNTSTYENNIAPLETLCSSFRVWLFYTLLIPQTACSSRISKTLSLGSKLLNLLRMLALLNLWLRLLHIGGELGSPEEMVAVNLPIPTIEGHK